MVSKPFIYVNLERAFENRSISLVVSDIGFATGVSAPSSSLYLPVNVSIQDRTDQWNASQVHNPAQLNTLFQMSIPVSEEAPSSHDGPFDTQSPSVATKTSRKWTTSLSALLVTYG